MERINVTVRARPLSPDDARTSPWRISGNSIFVPNNHAYKFDFDRILGENCQNLEVYQTRTKEIVSAAVRGFNGTVFAYGQTNSGKTHTMRGSAVEPGVIPLAVHDLFQTIHEGMDREFLVRMSYMEIYNEEINDLLAPEHRKLQIHENVETGIYVAGLREEVVASPEQVLDLMESGESHRHVGETNMNLHSSRSHTIFRMIIESRERSEDETVGNPCDAVRVSVLNLVDLAGSERAAKTGAEGVRLKEGSHINKSLMTLGTVIKKLSEGAESQGGHVPYRDSKLTRILQPALGGNANTAIICNITLAQIHSDETKSSLQFASRALRVTNCACVNEILTDAALLKRQKKEIQELRSKLQGAHSEHFEEEILNLRNTLLQTELERERIALELEEEKKAQAEREWLLQEQARKIENLSSIVLYSNRDEDRDHQKKEKRRDTWCPGNLLKGILKEDESTTQSNISAVKPMKQERNKAPLLPFEELVDENKATMAFLSKQEEVFNDGNNVMEDCTLPDPRALMHITNRRRGPVKKKSLVVENNELIELQAEYEALFFKFETQRTISEVKADYLIRKLAEANFSSDEQVKYTSSGDTNLRLMDSESILEIQELQEQIRMLEIEKSSSPQNLDSTVELATEDNICLRNKYEEEKELELANTLLIGIQEIVSEAQSSKNVIQNVSSFVDEVLESFFATVKTFTELKSLMRQSTAILKSTISNYENAQRCMKHKVTDLENEKFRLHNQSGDLYKQVEELRQRAENSEKALNEFVDREVQEKSELLTHIQMLETELSCLSSCSLAKEKESLRKDLEKTRAKFKDTEFKLKNVIQEKTKLEGEKSFAEREIKKLHGQKSLLERDINKRESLAGKRRDSAVERNTKVLDAKRTKSHGIPFEIMQEDYKNLEVLAFEMETIIASLEEQLAAANGEKEEAIRSNANLASESESLLDRLNLKNSELITMQEEISNFRSMLEQNDINHHDLKRSMDVLVEEKEELAAELTDALLKMEEEKSLGYAKEKASIEVIEEREKLHNAGVLLLKNKMMELTTELESSKEKCKDLLERLAYCKETLKNEKQYSAEKFLEIDQLRNGLKIAKDESIRSQEILTSNFDKLSQDHRQVCIKLDRLQTELNSILKEREDLLIRNSELDTRSDHLGHMENLQDQLISMTHERETLMKQIEEQRSHVVNMEDLSKSYDHQLSEAKDQVEQLTRLISSMEAKMHNDCKNKNKELTKVRMRLHWTTVKLDAVTGRHKARGYELDMMHTDFEEASTTLKKRLASSVIENLNLKKQLASASGN